LIFYNLLPASLKKLFAMTTLAAAALMALNLAVSS